MGRTFNRAPLTVNTPSSSDVKQYFFNHYKWKGLSDDKNFLTADQETFTDCNNVYMDEEGLLKSRPSLKVATVTRSNGVTNYVLSNILDVWTFEHVTVYKTKPASEYYLTFINDKFDEHIQVKSVENIKLVVADEKIFVFSEQSFEYYDMKENIYANAEKFIHIPVTKVMTNGVLDSTVDVESPNVLTTSHIIKHLYTSANQVNFKKLVGKRVSVEVNDISYDVDFVNNNELVFVNRYSGLTESNFSDANILGIDGEGIPLVETSTTRSMIISSYTYSIEPISKKPTVAWSIYHTVDGVIFNRLPDVVGVIGKPLISKDGNYCIVFMQDGPYIYSLLKTSDILKYPEWTNLLKSLDKEEYTDMHLEMHFNGTNNIGDVFNQSCVINGYFYADTSFAFVYGRDSVIRLGDPSYRRLICVYSLPDGKFASTDIFNSSGPNAAWSPVANSLSSNAILFTTSTDNNIVKLISNNIDDMSFSYSYDGYEAKLYIKNIVYSNELDVSNETKYTNSTLSATVTFVDNNDNTLVNKQILFNDTEYSPSANSALSFEDAYCTYTIQSVPVDNGFEQILKISVNTISATMIVSASESVPTSEDTTAAIRTNNKVPNISVMYDAITKYNRIFVDFTGILMNAGNTNYTTSKHYRATVCINASDSGVTKQFLHYSVDVNDEHRCPIKDSMITYNNRYTQAKLVKKNENSVISIHTIVFSDNLITGDLESELDIFSELYSAKDFQTELLKLSYPSCYLATNKRVFPYYDYTDDAKTYNPIPLLFEAKPVGFYYSGNANDSLYLATDDTLYASNVDKVITVTELIEGETNYLLPSFVALLSNYYFAKDNHLYISSPSVQFDVASNGTVKRTANDFKWYIPEISKQDFDFEITNLHVISNTDVAIFFEHSVSYVSWDSSVSAYRYYKSKLQTGCKQGCDVITSYDGKYVIFTSERGLVAMTYQEFTATTEQALTYLSDPIHTIFERYLAKNIKLFKYSYWIFVYKQDSKEFYLLDIRNNSWWPLTSLKEITKIVMQDDKPFFLMTRKMYNFSKAEIDYYDYDDTEYKIEWHIKSQKLYLNAVNYYKHIVNMTFVSIHDKELLQNANYNVDALDFKLQVTNYRKTVNGNIGNDDEYTTVNYTVESARTYVQRLNYSKVNEFQYMLSSNELNAINIPLSLSGITVKYKISNQVR